MDVKEFVSETLQQIIGGVQDAIDATSAYSTDLKTPRGGGSSYRVIASSSKDYDVDFDIAVTVQESKGAKGGIKVMGIGAGAEGSAKTETASRVKFTVPIRYPGSTLK